MSPVRRALAVAVAALVLVLPTACSVRAAAAGAEYLALGDSVTFGSHPVPSGTYAHPDRFHSYADRVADDGRLALVNAACPGETAASLIDTRAWSNGCENKPHHRGSSGYRQRHPLHVWYAGSQLQFAVDFLTEHPGTRLVSLAIGLNDLFVCRSTARAGCIGGQWRAFATALTVHLDTILSTLRSRAHYRGDLVVLTYYAADYSGTAPDTDQRRAIDEIIAAAAHRYKALVADGFLAFRQASTDHDGLACAAGLLANDPHGGCDIHPSAKGQDVLAKSVERALGLGPANPVAG